MATSMLVILPASLLLLLALCGSSLEASTQGEGQEDASAAATHHSMPSPLHAASLGRLLQRGRRSAELQAPPHYYRLAGLMGAPSKRDDGYWIWMPAHGYMSVPRDEVASSSGDKDSMGNLLRYGRK